MVAPLSCLFAVLALAGATSAAPATLAASAPPASTTAPQAKDNTPTQGKVTPLSKEQIDEWKEPVYYAGAAYCGTDSVKQWKCGPDCDKLSNVKVAATGGDNSVTPYWYVANDGKKVIVSVAGGNLTDPTMQATLADIGFRDVDERYLDHADGVLIHAGFHETFERMVDDIYKGVEGLGESAPKDILVVGHSLGAAVAEIFAVTFAKRWQDRTVTARLFAPPRVGNPAWANYVDEALGDRLHHVSIHPDTVTHLPTLAMGYRHPSGEVFVDSAGSENWVSCEGQENDKCQAQYEQDVPSIEDLLKTLPSRLQDQPHSGPYFSEIIGTRCTAKAPLTGPITGPINGPITG